jgi:hypothetical protein
MKHSGKTYAINADVNCSVIIAKIYYLHISGSLTALAVKEFLKLLYGILTQLDMKYYDGGTLRYEVVHAITLYAL